MKKIILLISIGVFVNSRVNGQHITTDRVPAIVSKAFRTKFYTASQESWSIEKPGVYEVVFFNLKKKQSAQFDSTGKWVETETEIGYRDMPSPVFKTIGNKFSGFSIQESNQVDTPDGTTYEVTVVKGKESYELTLSAKGEVLKKEEAKPDQD